MSGGVGVRRGNPPAYSMYNSKSNNTKVRWKGFIYRTLRSYENVLNELLNGRQKEDVNEPVLQEAYTFFSAIADILMKEADPISKSV
jgi:hypothetical protein